MDKHGGRPVSDVGTDATMDVMMHLDGLHSCCTGTLPCMDIYSAIYVVWGHQQLAFSAGASFAAFMAMLECKDVSSMEWGTLETVSQGS